MTEFESRMNVESNFYEEDSYLFPDEALLSLSNDDLRRVIRTNLKDGQDQTDGTDFNSDIRIDSAQDIIEQARDILLARGMTFTDDEKCDMRFLSWPLTEEDLAQEAIKKENEKESILRGLERRQSIIEKYNPWIEILVQGKIPPSDADFSDVDMQLGVSGMRSGETKLPTWAEVCRMKEELQKVANLEVDAHYSGNSADKESNLSCFWRFYFKPPLSPEAWLLLQKWWKEGRYTGQPELWVGETHWTLECWPTWGTEIQTVAEIDRKKLNSGYEGDFEDSVSILTNLLESHNLTGIETKNQITAAEMADTAETYTLAESECLARWKGRSLRYRAQHRKNVIVAFLFGRITFHSFVLGLRFAPSVEYLACIRPERGMIAVCPERVASNNSVFADID